MGESDLQAIGGNKFKKYLENVPRSIKESASNGDPLKNIVQYFTKNGKVHEALSACIRAYSSDFFDSECINILIDSITQKAKEYLRENAKLTKDHLMCTVCDQFMKDPVTLRCGHTYSKKCMLSNLDDDAFVCEKCESYYVRGYVEQVKNNVTLLTLIDIVFKSECSVNTKDDEHVSSDKQCDSDKDVPEDVVEVNKTDADLTILLPPVTSEDYSRKGDLLVNRGKLEDAFRAYLISLTLDSNMTQTKEKSNKLLHQLLAKYSCRFCCSKIKFNDLSLKTTELRRRKSLTGSDESLCSADSNDSFVAADESYSSSSDENDNLSKDRNEAHWNACADDEKLHAILQVFLNDIEKMTDENSVADMIDTSSIDKQDFECPLCIRIFWEPVTTPCGHTFCRVCLNRSLDHQVYCPMCKTSLSGFLAQRVLSTSETIELAIKTLLPNEYFERRTIYEEEMKELLNAGKDPEHEIPLFICTIAYPTVPCPLHVYEPRYRLMIRQCMESGSRQFGMCAYIDDNIAEYGTLLEIRHIEYFPDGRSVVNAVGSKRFRILRKGERDGYHTASVEFLKDEAYANVDTEDIMENHDRVYKICQSWFMHLPMSTKCQIIDHFGPMPQIEEDYINNPNGPSWFWWIIAVLPLEPRLQQLLLSMTSLARRLNTLNRILLHMQSNMIA
ncbi:LON peptidase N-terminal domain and RING finger protein 3-like [Uloborus diversus]|uniref:LON peptidase N-terminal domain and RING finger protein 3-like n=1 Tax=Uloborus diversus TaxID=327109 RepID=UPI00240A7BE2|nr:LON peptidase N-terminal domain and RING finger protein 3-like [Uloborus diversus]